MNPNTLRARIKKLGIKKPSEWQIFLPLFITKYGGNVLFGDLYV
jgi:hypothetical protein